MTRNASVLLLAACAALAGVGSAQDNGPPAIEGWGTVVNPDGDCSLKTDEGKLVIKVPGGQHDLWFGRKQFNAPRVLQEVQGDFVAQVKVSADWKPSGQIPDSKSSPFNAAGLVVWDSEKQYLRFERNRVKHDKYFNLLTPVYDRDGKRQNDAKWSEQDTFKGRSTWLRIERTGQKITAAISHDGQKWTDRGSLTTTFPKKVRVGVFAINYSTSEFVAEFEEFKVDGK